MDTYTSPKKQHMLLKLILTYYNKGVEALNADASFAKLAALPVREAIGRFKYVAEAECEARYAAALDELNEEVRALTEGGNEDA